MVLSDLFNKLHSLTVGRGITYTITECLLDQVSSIHEFFENSYEMAHDFNHLLIIFRHLNVFWMQMIPHIPLIIQRSQRKQPHNSYIQPHYL